MIRALKVLFIAACVAGLIAVGAPLLYLVVEMYR